MGKRLSDIDYGEIAQVLRDEIRSGAYSAPGAFPSLTKIMRRFGVTRMSAVRSVAELKRMGLVSVRRGAGTFVLAQNRTIGLVLPGTADSEFFAAVMDGLVANCAEHGFDLVAGDVFPVDHALRGIQAQKLAEHLVSVKVAGVVMQPVGFSEDAGRINGIIAATLDKAGIPMVLVDYDIESPPARSRYDLVAIDNFGAGRKVAGHLLSRGAKRICCLLRRLCADSVRTRFAGVDAAFWHATGRHADILVAEPDDAAAIAAGLKKLRPDAVVCSNDIAADILSKTLGKLRIKVPRDLLLAGFDDVKLAGEIGLTSIRQPCADLAATAFRTLVERIKNPSLPPRQILLDTSLVARGSTLGVQRDKVRG